MQLTGTHLVSSERHISEKLFYQIVYILCGITSIVTTGNRNSTQTMNYDVSVNQGRSVKLRDSNYTSSGCDIVRRSRLQSSNRSDFVRTTVDDQGRGSRRSTPELSGEHPQKHSSDDVHGVNHHFYMSGEDIDHIHGVQDSVSRFFSICIDVNDQEDGVQDDLSTSISKRRRSLKVRIQLKDTCADREFNAATDKELKFICVKYRPVLLSMTQGINDFRGDIFAILKIDVSTVFWACLSERLDLWEKVCNLGATFQKDCSQNIQASTADMNTAELAKVQTDADQALLTARQKIETEKYGNGKGDSRARLCNIDLDLIMFTQSQFFNKVSKEQIDHMTSLTNNLQIQIGEVGTKLEETVDKKLETHRQEISQQNKVQEDTILKKVDERLSDQERRVSNMLEQISTNQKEAERAATVQFDKLETSITNKINDNETSSIRSSSSTSSGYTRHFPSFAQVAASNRNNRDHPTHPDHNVRIFFDKQYWYAIRTVAFVCNDIPHYPAHLKLASGDDITEDEMKYYIEIVKFKILAGYFKMTKARVEFFMGKIDWEGDAGGLWWNRVAIDTETGEYIKKRNGKKMELRIYMRFDSTTTLNTLDQDKVKLTAGRSFYMNPYFPKFFKIKEGALTEIGWKWVEEKRNAGYKEAMFMIAYEPILQDVYIEIRLHKQCAWNRLKDDERSLFDMSMNDIEIFLKRMEDRKMYEDRRRTELEAAGTSGEFMEVADDSDWRMQIAKGRKRNRHQIDDPHKEVVLTPKDGSTDKGVFDVMERMKKKKAVSGKINFSFHVKTSTGSAAAKPKPKNYMGPKGSLETRLEDLVKNNDKTKETLTKRFTANRKKLVKSLKSQNVVPNAVHGHTWDRKTKIEKQPQIFRDVLIEVETPLMLISVCDFLRWTKFSKIQCMTKMIQITDLKLDTDEENVLQSIRIVFKSVDGSLAAYVHVYMSNSRVMIQSSDSVGLFGFSEWLYKALFCKIFEKNSVEKRKEIDTIRAEIDAAKIPIYSKDKGPPKSKKTNNDSIESKNPTKNKLSVVRKKAPSSLSLLRKNSTKDTVNSQGLIVDQASPLLPSSGACANFFNISAANPKSTGQRTLFSYNFTDRRTEGEEPETFSDEVFTLKDILRVDDKNKDGESAIKELEDVNVNKVSPEKEKDSKAVDNVTDETSDISPKQPQQKIVKMMRPPRLIPPTFSPTTPTQTPPRSRFPYPKPIPQGMMPRSLNPEATVFRKPGPSFFKPVDNSTPLKSPTPISDDVIFDDFVGENDNVLVEIPRDLMRRFDQILREGDGDGKLKEMQAHFTGRRREENGKKILTIYEMIIPAQTGNYTSCRLTNADFLNRLKGQEIVGMIHTHCDQSGIYLSGQDQHTTGKFQHCFCANDIYISAVYDPTEKTVGFMKIKSDKVGKVYRCALLHGPGTLAHDHPECWAMVETRILDFDVIVTDIRDKLKLRSTTGDLFDPTAPTRQLRTAAYEPLTNRDILDIHGIESRFASLEVLARKIYTGPETETFHYKKPGELHDDTRYFTSGLLKFKPIDDYLTVERPGESLQGVLLQPRGTIEVNKVQNDASPKPSENETKDEKILRLENMVKRLEKELSNANLSNHNLNRNLQRLVDKKTVFDSLKPSNGEKVTENSLAVDNLLGLMGKLMETMTETKSREKNSVGDWMKEILEGLRDNRNEIKETFNWVITNWKLGSDVTEGKLGTSLGNEITLLSFNLDGHSKRTVLLELIENLHPLLFALQETMLNCSNRPEFENCFRDYKFVSTTSDRHAGIDDIDLFGNRLRGGVSLAWHKCLDHKVNALSVTSNNFVSCIFSTGPTTKCLVTSIYLPTAGADDEFQKVLQDLENLIISKRDEVACVYIIGDLNVSNKSSRLRQRHFNDWLERTAIHRLDPIGPTHKHKRMKTFNNLDAVLTDDPDDRLSITTLKEEDLKMTFRSDHSPILFKFPISEDGSSDLKLEKELYLGGMWKYNPNRLFEVNEAIGEYWKEAEKLPKESLDLRLRIMMTSLVQAFNEQMPKPRPSNGPKGLLGLKKERKLLETLRTSKNIPDNIRFAMQRDIDEIRKRRKMASIQSVRKKVESSEGEIYKLYSNMKGNASGMPSKMVIGGKVFLGDEVILGVTQYYQEQGDVDNALFHDNFDEDELEECQRMIKLFMSDERIKSSPPMQVSEEDLWDVIMSFKNNTASDVRGVNHQMLKLLNGENFKIVHKWIQDTFDLRYFSTPELHLARFLILYKNKGSKLSIDQYRAIKVAPCLLRIVQRLILRGGFTDFVDSTIDATQWGFSKNKSFEMAIAQVNTILREHRDEGRSCACASVDLVKMFPRISYPVVIAEMIVRGASIDDIAFFVGTSLGRSCILKNGKYIFTENVVFDSFGAREGAVDSSDLARLIQSILSKPLEQSDFGIIEKRVVYEKETGTFTITVGKKSIVLVADDSWMTEQSAIRMADLLKAVKSTAKISRVGLNRTKTFVMFYGEDAEKMKEEWRELKDEGETDIDCADSLDYLGIKIENDDKTEERNVERKIEKAKENLRLISACGLHSKFLMPLSIRLNLLSTYIYSKVISALNAFILDAKAEKLLRNFSDSCVRKVTLQHENSSTPALYLLVGMMPLSTQWRIACVSLFIRVLTTENNLREVWLYHLINMKRYKYNYMGMMERIFLSAGITGYHNLFYISNLNQKNRKSVFKLIKKRIVDLETEKLKRMVCAMKRTPLIDMERIVPGKGLLSLMTVEMSEASMRGRACQIGILSNNFLTSRLDKNSTQKCFARNCDAHVDGALEMLQCKANVRLNSMKREIISLLPPWHILRNHELAHPCWRIFLIDPYSGALGSAKLVSGQFEEERIGDLCRLACEAAQNFRSRCRREFYENASREKLASHSLDDSNLFHKQRTKGVEVKDITTKYLILFSQIYKGMKYDDTGVNYIRYEYIRYIQTLIIILRFEHERNNTFIIWIFGYLHIRLLQPTGRVDCPLLDSDWREEVIAETKEEIKACGFICSCNLTLRGSRRHFSKNMVEELTSHNRQMSAMKLVGEKWKLIAIEMIKDMLNVIPDRIEHIVIPFIQVARVTYDDVCEPVHVRIPETRAGRKMKTDVGITHTALFTIPHPILGSDVAVERSNNISSFDVRCVHIRVILKYNAKSIKEHLTFIIRNMRDVDVFIQFSENTERKQRILDSWVVFFINFSIYRIEIGIDISILRLIIMVTNNNIISQTGIIRTIFSFIMIVHNTQERTSNSGHFMYCCGSRELNKLKDGFRISPIIHHQNGGCGRHRGVRVENERVARCGAVGEHFNFTKFQQCVTLAADQYKQVADQSVTHNEHLRM